MVKRKGTYKPKSFILYFEHWPILEQLTMEERGRLITAIYKYVMADELPSFSNMTDVAFQLIQNRIDWDMEKWGRACVNNEAVLSDGK